MNAWAKEVPHLMVDVTGSELSFYLLDELSRATLRGRVSANELLASVRVHRIGPLVELMLLNRDGSLPLGALPDCSVLDALTKSLQPPNASQGSYSKSDKATAGFITAGRTITPHADEDLRWVAFRQRAQQAAELSLPKAIAQGLMGAMSEIEENIHLHSQRPETGIIGFQGSPVEFELVVADSGVGILASLRTSPTYTGLDDAGTALRLALQDGTSRLSHTEPNRGHGYRNLFRNVANLNGELRFRSDDQAVTIEGVSPELVKSHLRQKTPITGFSASIICRPHSVGQPDC